MAVDHAAMIETTRNAVRRLATLVGACTLGALLVAGTTAGTPMTRAEPPPLARPEPSASAESIARLTESTAATEPEPTTTFTAGPTPTGPTTTSGVMALSRDQFAIGFGTTVSDGSPGPGAGNLENGGDEDAYTFDATAGDDAIFDVVAGDAGIFRWRLAAPDGSPLFDGLYVDRRLVLPATGSYTITVYGATATSIGTYSFQLLLTPPSELFAIAFGDTVLSGAPAAGAGNVEVAGAADIYTFDGQAGQQAILDVLAGNNVFIRWTLLAPDGSELFGAPIGDRALTLAQTGTYTLNVHGSGIDDTGTYSFRLLDAPAAEEFTIAFGDAVSDGVPGAGAGNLEQPGAVDVFRFDAVAGQVAILDALAGNPAVFHWALTAPDGAVLSDVFFVDQQVTLPQDGTYTVTVSGQQVASTGTYSFQLSAAPPVTDEFTIAFGHTVSDGFPAPGAGNLEAPGAVDVYRFDATAGQVAILDALAGNAAVFHWALTAPDGEVLFDVFFVDQQVTLPQDGTYTLTVDGQQVASTGIYSFQLLAVTVDEFAIAFGDIVSDGMPGPSAGNIEAPGATDVYTFTGTAGLEAIFDLLGSTLDTFWTLTAPDGDVLFATFVRDRQLTLPADGTYTLTVRGADPADTGTYSFQLRSTTPQQFDIAIGDTVSDGVPEPGAGNLDEPGARDIYRFEGTAGQELSFERLAFDPPNVQWILRGPDGSLVFWGFVSSDVTLPDTGSYTLDVASTSLGTGSYSFRIVDLGELLDEFTITFGDRISDGVPAPGAGNLEFDDSVDIYRFDATAGQFAIFDVVLIDNVESFDVVAPDGSTVLELTFTGGFDYVDHLELLDQTGTYTITVAERRNASDGTYEFRLLEWTNIDVFDITFSQMVADGIPGSGAGNLESPFSVDQYHFDATAGTEAAFTALAGLPDDLRWVLHAPDGSVVFDEPFADQEATLDQTGTYTLTVQGLNRPGPRYVGTYSFRILDLGDLHDEFTIAFGDGISDGVPAPGAGNLELADSVDVYSFDATAGQIAVFDVVLIDNVASFTVVAPDGSTVVDTVFTGGFDYVDRVEPLNQTGTYTITVDGRRNTTDGTYEFRLLERVNIDEFTIALGDQVMDGVPGPGAGNLESPASVDRYHFHAIAGTRASFPTFFGLRTDLRWVLHAPDGAVVLDDAYFGREEDLDQTGTYMLTVLALDRPGQPYVGTYRFGLVNATIDEFTIAFGDTVSDGVPDVGAGNIEIPGARDFFYFDVTAGQEANLEVLAGDPNELIWELVAPDASLVFPAGPVATTTAVLDQTGTYTLIVSGASATSSGIYSFSLTDTSKVDEFTIGFSEPVSDGVPGPGAGNIESADAIDRYHFDATAGTIAGFFNRAGTAGPLRWILTAPDGTTVFEEPYGEEQLTLDQTGTYILDVRSDGMTVSTYSFHIVDLSALVDEFTIAVGDTVSDGVPGPGAGNIELPEGRDHYRFDATAGQVVHLDVLAGDPSQLVWRLEAPDGTIAFDFEPLASTTVPLEQTGPYMLRVSGAHITSTGTYSFRLSESQVDEFTIAYGDTVSDGVPGPGAGNLEVAGARDLYHFDGTDGQTIRIAAIDRSGTNIIFTLHRPSRGSVRTWSNLTTNLTETGTYTIEVFSDGAPDIGTYSLQLLLVPDLQEFTIAIGDTISDGVPAAGAGNLEAPGAKDTYRFEGTAGQVIAFEVLAFAEPSQQWALHAPDGSLVFFELLRLSDEEVTLAQTGTYELSVYSAASLGVGTYSFSLTDVTPPPPTTEPPDTTEPPAEPIEVDIDVLPRSLRNDGRGVIPVVVFGNAEVDGSQIAPASIELEGMPTVTMFGWPVVVVIDVDRDGHDDLGVLIDDVAGAIPTGATNVTLTAELTDGTAIAGTDTVRLRGSRR